MRNSSSLRETGSAAAPSTQEAGAQAAPFAHRRYWFTTGLQAGSVAHVRDDNGDPLLTYRSFASVVGVVAALMAAVVFVTGAAAMLFLVAESRPFAAGLAFLLSISFSGVMAMLVPPVSAELRAGGHVVLRIHQQSRFAFPSATFSIDDAEDRMLARVRRSVFSRLGRNRWTMLSSEGRDVIAMAIEESLGRALVRKIAGKFRRSLDANIIVISNGVIVGTIVRRPAEDAYVDYISLEHNSPLDRRLAVALATLILGSEP